MEFGTLQILIPRKYLTPVKFDPMHSFTHEKFEFLKTLDPMYLDPQNVKP